MDGNVKIIVGDIFQSKAQTLVNTVNCVGVMGKGLALEFKKRHPGMYKDYLRRCEKKRVRLGEPYLFQGLEPPWILNFPTKDHWRSISRLEDIVLGLDYLNTHYKQWGITSIAVPSLGCQQGQLEWRAVIPILYKYLSRLDIPVELYGPVDLSVEELMAVLEEDKKGTPKINKVVSDRLKPAWVALAAIIGQIEKEPYHYPIGRMKFQKIAYFATEFGLPTGLDYKRGSYGPFSDELKGGALTRLINNGVLREERSGEGFVLKTGPTYNDIKKFYKHDIDEWQPNLNEIVDLFLRISTSRQAEIVAAVHFVAKELKEQKRGFPTERDVLDAVMEWKHRRKPPLDVNEVALAIRNLAALGWIDVRASSNLPIDDEESLIAPHH